MLAHTFFVALLSLSLSVSSVQAAPSRNRVFNKNHNKNNAVASCPAPTTVVVTSTVTPGAAATTVNSNAAATTSAAAANNNSGNNKGGKGSTTSTSATAAVTSAAATNNNTGGNDPQTSLTLDPRVIASGFANNGQDVPTAGQVASLTSTNNFINYCLTVPNLPITNGKQITAGSCNPAPIGAIPSVDNMPSAKFTNPPNFGTIKANTSFTISMNIQGMETGFFTNAQQTYFGAPQQLNSKGQIQGHSHCVIEALTSLTQQEPTNPKNFVFFKGLNVAAVNGVLTADVTAGLPAGVYKLSSINSAANHQPAIVPVAQHGSLDDVIYFTVTADGKPAAASTATSGNNASTGKNTGTKKN